jgi:hypothetical protein
LQKILSTSQDPPEYETTFENSYGKVLGDMLAKKSGTGKRRQKLQAELLKMAM